MCLYKSQNTKKITCHFITIFITLSRRLQEFYLTGQFALSFEELIIHRPPRETHEPKRQMSIIVSLLGNRLMHQAIRIWCHSH